MPSTNALPKKKFRKQHTKQHPAVEGVQSYIRVHGLRPGDPLPSEAVLCDELGCSRSSLREAMRTLVSLDIVEIRHGYGTFVSGMSLAPLVDGMVLRLLLDQEKSLENLLHVVNTRIALDLSLADELVGIHQGKDLSELENIVSDMRRAHANNESFASHDQQFHTTLLRDIQNPIIQELSDAFWQIHHTVVPMLQESGAPRPDEALATIDAHSAILQSLEEGDADLYRTRVLEHYRPLQSAVERAVAQGTKTN